MATQSDLLPSWRFSQNVAANGGQPARLERSGRVPQQDENPPRQPKGDTRKMELDDSSKEKAGRVDHVSLQHQMTHHLAIQEAKEASSARKAIRERLLAYLDKEIGTCDRTTPRSALNFWRNRIRNMRHH